MLGAPNIVEMQEQGGRRRPVAVGVMAALAFALAGCGTASTQSGPAPASAPPSSASAPETSEAVAESEMRILPVDGDLAEIVFAIGLGDQVVATDISATYPPEADALPEVGYQRALAPEPIAAFEPTIVLATDLAGPSDTLDALRRLGIETVVIDREQSITGPGVKIRAVGAALGADDAAEHLAAGVDDQIAAAIERVGDVPAPRVAVLYLRGESVQLLFGEGSGVNWLVRAAGAIDVADELGVTDHAPINAETLVAAAPDFLIVPQGGLDSVGGLDGLLTVPGIAQTPAGQRGNILVYDDQYLLGNGPRTGDLLDDLITDLHGDN